MRRNIVKRVLVAAAAVALAVANIDAARSAPGFSLAGDDLGRVLLGAAAGLAVVAAGLGRNRLLTAAGLAWLASGLATPGTRMAILFTLGLVTVAATPALLGHALLATAGDGLRAPADRALAAALHVSLIGLLGLLPTLLFDPAATGCAACAANLLEVADAPDAAAALSRWGVRLGFVAVAGALALLVWRLARAPGARRLRAAWLVVPGCVSLTIAAAQLAHAWPEGALRTDATARGLWIAQAASLLGVAAGVGLGQVAALKRRARLAGLVVELGDAQRPGGLRDALAELLGDEQIELLHRSSTDDAWIDVTGTRREPPADVATTQLARDGLPVALLYHRPGRLDDPRLATEIEHSVRLGLEHERLQAELRRQLADLRRSRADIAAAGEAERRTLERDLHDGAQQRLVAFAFALGVARRHAAPGEAGALARAHEEVQEALAELRDVAHGLYPVALAEAGLAAAVESLGDRRAGLRADALTAERFAPAVEEAAYLAIADLAEHWAPEPVVLSAARADGQLVIELRSPAAAPADVIDLEDRVGALGGVVAVHGRRDETRVRVELPCG